MEIQDLEFLENSYYEISLVWEVNKDGQIFRCTGNDLINEQGKSLSDIYTLKQILHELYITRVDLIKLNDFSKLHPFKIGQKLKNNWARSISNRIQADVVEVTNTGLIYDHKSNECFLTFVINDKYNFILKEMKPNLYKAVLADTKEYYFFSNIIEKEDCEV